jgi:aromatic-L-amino-acid decarboxylase
MLGLPPEFSGIITDGASMSSFLAVATAREAAQVRVGEAGARGRDPPRLRAYASEEAHSSVEKAVIAAGLGRDGFRAVPVDAEFSMQSDALASMIGQDIAKGWWPACVVATVGTTSTTSVDPVAAIADVCRNYGLAARRRCARGDNHLWRCDTSCGLRRSIYRRTHKWLFILDCSALCTRRP